MRKIANSIHHTHWDLIWYFTTQDATIQLTYNMKELLRGFKEGKINNFFFDGQTTPFDEYLSLHPEDEEEIRDLVTSGKLVIGPFNSHLDSFISSGESVINNLRLGFKTGERLGKVSKIAYLPDTFGHSIDYPKIFNLFDIHEFVIKRGVGDEYDVNSEFMWQGKDGSEVLVFTMIAGYGYGCYAFKEKTLFTDDAVDYNKIRVEDLIERINGYSSLENDFIFLLGFDQNPAIMNINELIEYHNGNQDDYEFVETTWEAYFKKIRESGVELKTHNHELFATQYHRVHRSIFSARADIKAMQDEVERILTYQVQPYMTLLDDLGIPYDESLVNKAWETLILCQTHSSANLTNETNEYIKVETNNARNLANSVVSYLNKLVSISLENLDDTYTPLLVVNPLPYTRTFTKRVQIFTKTQYFTIVDVDGNIVDYTIINSETKNNGVLRKDVQLINDTMNYYVHDISLSFEDVSALGYEVYRVIEDTQDSSVYVPSRQAHFIENEYYKVYQDEDGIVVQDKRTGNIIHNAIYLEESGDEGDSFDYSYPTHDWLIKDYLNYAEVDYVNHQFDQVMTLQGNLEVPKDLSERRQQVCKGNLEYFIQIRLNKKDPVINVSGKISNDSKQHRIRIVFKGLGSDVVSHSLAGTQFGYIDRMTRHPKIDTWKEDGWFEEPSATFPLLNHVSVQSNEGLLNVHTRSSKEYELIGEGFNDIAVTLFRSYGALGYPDLNRRPGRPGGLDYMIFETSDSQMIGDNHFELGFSYSDIFDGNDVRNEYIEFVSDPIVHHQQAFDKSINAIQYFPTNPWDKALPHTHSLFKLNNFKGSFGTLVKEQDAYLMRVYNNESYEISLDFENDSKWNVVDTDLVGNDKDGFDATIKNNELRIIKLKGGKAQ